MAEEESSEKTEEPTQKRLDKAREEGQVLRSQELSVAVVVISAIATLLVIGKSIYTALITVLRANFSMQGFNDPAVMSRQLWASAAQLAPSLSILVTVILSVIFISNSALGGFNFNISNILPKANRVNPFVGIKRIFGAQAWFELLKGVLKTLLILIATYLVFQYFKEDISQFGVVSQKVQILSSGIVLGISALVISLFLIVIAMLDVPIKVNQHRQKLRMTKQEIKEEYKEAEGKPEVRNRIRQRQREIALNKMMKAIEKADVIVTNPMHFAVALAYSPGSSRPPVVIGKGIDNVAIAIRKKAGDLGIPLFQSPDLARALYFTTRENSEIPEALFHCVAQVIAYIFRINMGYIAKDAVPPIPDVPREMRFDANGKKL
jgi:flagellar biosynthetic protein FlhB